MKNLQHPEENSRIHAIRHSNAFILNINFAVILAEKLRKY